MTYKTSSLPRLPLLGRKYANKIYSLTLCQHNKNYKRYYYYIDIWQSMYQYIRCIFLIFIGKCTDMPIKKCGKLGNLANFAIKHNTTKDHEPKISWQTFGKLGKLQ